MAAKCVKYFLLCFIVCNTLFSQTSVKPNNAIKEYPDYKDGESHKKFYKRRWAVATWQVQQLKKGALVVILKTNNLLINELKKRGQIDLAHKKSVEQYVENKNMMYGFIDGYKFSKIYFIYSNCVDSIKKGVRTGIFLDTTMKINAEITMNESFYLFLQSGTFVENSTIGFVKEDTAKFVKENGNVKNCDCYSTSNKFGHQVYAPFPYITSAVSYGLTFLYFKNFDFNYEIYEGNTEKEFDFFVDKHFLEKQRAYKEKKINPPKIKASKTKGVVTLNKLKIYEWVVAAAQNFHDELENFYEKHSNESAAFNDPEIKPFLY